MYAKSDKKELNPYCKKKHFIFRYFNKSLRNLLPYPNPYISTLIYNLNTNTQTQAVKQ